MGCSFSRFLYFFFFIMFAYGHPSPYIQCILTSHLPLGPRLRIIYISQQYLFCAVIPNYVSLSPQFPLSWCLIQMPKCSSTGKGS
ncbi:hypothetical protein BDZ97DRAFT_1836844 [Flammula alnicola]|nr:hypothetical protein BDZ97DRAFT_1836844 [Flammula alnicola]